jgi:anti-sigma B factor antagonist
MPEQHYGALTMSSDREGDVHSICLYGELDLANVAVVEREFTRVEGTDAGTIVVDLSGLEWVDSTGVRLLLSAQARSRALPHRLALRPAPADVQRVFDICGVSELLPFAASPRPSHPS